VYLGCKLPVAVDSAVALLQPVRVPGNLPVEQTVAMGLQIDSLAGSIRGQQDPHRIQLWRLLEHRLDALPLRLILAAVKQGDALRRYPGTEQSLVQPPWGIAVLGENDHTFIGPGSRLDDWVKPLAEGRQLRFRPVLGVPRPSAEALQQVPLMCAQ